MTRLRHRPAVVLAMLLVGAVPGVTAAQTEGTLCDVLPLAELHAIGDLRYAEPEFGDDTFCFYETAAEQTGPHTVNLDFREAPFAIPFEEVRETVRAENPGIEDVTIAGQPGFVDTAIEDVTSLTVGLGERQLSLIISVGASAEAVDLDPVAYLLDIGAIIVPRLIAPEEAMATASPSAPPLVDAGGYSTP